MKHNLQKSSVFSSFSVIAVFVLLCIIGAGLLPRLFISLTPSQSLPSITVRYSWHKASAGVIEKHVTAPLEGLFSTIGGLQNISSHTSRSSGSIEMEFNEDIDMDIARFEVSALIRQAYSGFPEQVSYPQVTLNMPNDESQSLLSYTLFGDNSAQLIQQYAENYIKPPLANIKGVYQVHVYGATPFAWFIRYETDKLEALELSEKDLKRAINNYFTQHELGYASMGISEGHAQIGVRISPGVNTAGWENIPVTEKNGRIIYLTDVAKIRYSEQEPDQYYRVNGLNTINLVIKSEKQVNSLKLAGTVKKQVKKIRQELPKSYSMVNMYDATDYILKELNKVAIRTVIALVVLLSFVWLISRRSRYVGLITISLFANLCIAVIFYVFLGVEIHIYSLAGMTISLGIIIDNSIIMSDHIRHRGNKRAFLSILAATLTTIGALSLIFFLDIKQQLNLFDFSLIIIINLGISLFVALFLIPALLEKLPIPPRKSKRTRKRLKRISIFTGKYSRMVYFQQKWKWAFIVLLILLFGLPVYELPEEYKDADTAAKKIYNATLGSDVYAQSIKPVTDKIFGGTLRLFTQFVYESSYYSTPERTRLYVSGKMPEGSTIHQLNKAVKHMESYLAEFPEIDMYTTSIHSYRNAQITIYFHKESEKSYFPFYLKGLLIQKANSLGGMDWGIYGVGRGFSNSVSNDFRNSVILLYGYNYKKLYGYAEVLKDNLGKNPRVRKMQIRGKSSWFQPPLRSQLTVQLNEDMLSQLNYSTIEIFDALKRKSLRAESIGEYFIGNQLDKVLLESDKENFDKWKLQNEFLPAGDRKIKLKGIGEITKKPIGNDIYKKDQQYQLALEYDFVGPSELGTKVQEKHVENLNSILPLGYKATLRTYNWRTGKSNRAVLLVLVIVIIFFICSVLFESLKQPFVILSLIPISFIGAFLTFYLFDVNFDQGGFASFILLAGITVNAGLYIINEYNNIIKQQKPGLRSYMKAFNHKVVPIILTITSTIMGLVPFLLGGQSEPFWFAFAAGSIGGLIFSFLGLILFLPVFFLKREKKKLNRLTNTPG